MGRMICLVLAVGLVIGWLGVVTGQTSEVPVEGDVVNSPGRKADLKCVKCSSASACIEAASKPPDEPCDRWMCTTTILLKYGTGVIERGCNSFSGTGTGKQVGKCYLEQTGTRGAYICYCNNEDGCIYGGQDFSGAKDLKCYSYVCKKGACQRAFDAKNLKPCGTENYEKGLVVGLGMKHMCATTSEKDSMNDVHITYGCRQTPKEPKCYKEGSRDTCYCDTDGCNGPNGGGGAGGQTLRAFFISTLIPIITLVNPLF